MRAGLRLSHLYKMAPAAALVAGSILVAAPAASVETPSAGDTAPPRTDGKADTLRDQLRSLRETIETTNANRRKLEAEVEAIKDDRAKLKQSLIDTSRRLDAAGVRMDEGQLRLDTLTGSEEAIRHSLEARRAVLGEILAVLQRMGRGSPPALLVRPDDLLAAVHTSILLGAVVPEMRAEAEALGEDLRQLVELRTSIVAERERLSTEQKTLELERTRLTLLTDARQRAQGETEGALESERTRVADLARQTTTVEGLIARVEAEVAGAQRARDEAVKAEETRQQQAALETRDQQARIAASPFKDSARLAPAIAFGDAKGKLPMPVSGAVVRPWGVPDGFGGTEKGLSIGARAASPVTSPTDGWIIFAGPYRSYGQLVIVNAGSGYHVVLAGMERTSVAVGQFVLSGEPIGTMGNGAARTAAAIAIGATAPILYVEFRKDGSAIDPSPWWAQPDTQRVRG